MKITDLSQADSELVLAHFNSLSESSLRSRFGFSPSQSTLESYIRFMFSGHDFVFAAMKDSKVVGLAHLAVKGGVAELGLSILDEAQGQGLGRVLVGQCLEQCQKRNVKEMLLLTVAHNFKVLRLLRRYPHRMTSGLEGSMAAIDVSKWASDSELKGLAA